MEASALRYQSAIGLHGRSPLLRLQSDERLIALLRRGNTGAFEVLVSRYESRLLAFCRHLLGSREDAEDVLQEVMAAAFNAIVADHRPINVRPWLYRIARNRSLNHMRKTQAIGVDSMDHHLADHGTTTADKVHEREKFRMLVGDIQDLPETQRTALVLREMDALAYEQIAEAMETTVSSVKSLLVRARVSLAEAAEARMLSCEEVRIELGEVAEGLRKKSSPLVRRHLKGCKRCSAFKTQLKHTNKALAALLPVGPLVVFKKLAFWHLGHSAGTGAGATAAGSAGAMAGASGVFGGGSIVSAGMGAVATKAAAGLAAAAIVTAGAVEADHHSTAHHPAAPVPAAQAASDPSPIAPVHSYAEKPSTVASHTHRAPATHTADTVTKQSAVAELATQPLSTATVASNPATTAAPTTTTPATTAPPGRTRTETDPTVLPPNPQPSPAPPLSVGTAPAQPVTTSVPVATPTDPMTTTAAAAPPQTTSTTPPPTAPTAPVVVSAPATAPPTTPTTTPTTPAAEPAAPTTDPTPPTDPGTTSTAAVVSTSVVTVTVEPATLQP